MAGTEARTPEQLAETPLLENGAEVMRLLIEAGGSLTDTDANGATPLALAAFCGQAEVTKLLVGKEGVDVECTDNSGATPLWLASAAGEAHSRRLSAPVKEPATVTVSPARLGLLDQ